MTTGDAHRGYSRYLLPSDASEHATVSIMTCSSIMMYRILVGESIDASHKAVG